MFFLFLSFLILCILNKEIVINSTIEAFKLWGYTLFPSLFINFILVDYILNSKTIRRVNSILKVVFLSMIVGNPGGAKIINKYELPIVLKTKLISIFSFISPIFLFSYFKYDLNFYLSYYISGLAFLLFIPSSIKYVDKEEKYNNIIGKNINILFNILGVMIITTIMCDMIFKYLNRSDLEMSIIHSLIEITGGIKRLRDSGINSIGLELFLLSFGGLSIHLQIIAISKIKYYVYLRKRFIISILAVILYYFPYFYILLIIFIIIRCIMTIKKKRGKEYVCI